jgi:hypothetical protein
MLNTEQAIEAWQKFESRANAKRSTQIDRIKADREFLSGNQWDDDDAKVIDGTRLKKTVNILGNSVNSTVNVYASYPYKFYSPIEEIDQACEAFLKAGSNARAPYDALYNDTAFGLAYMAIGSEQVMDPQTGEALDVPALYNIDKIENVYYDPDSVEMDGHDAMEVGIVEYRSKEWVRAKYGEEWAPEKGVRALVNTTDNHSADTMAIVTYYRMHDNKCEVYRMLNQDFIDEPITLEIDRIPVFPVYGERIWVDDTMVWQGLVRKGMPIQKLINYAFTQLCERLAQAPKSAFITEPEAVEGYADGYRNFNKNINPLLLYNRWSPDHKIEYNAPTRVDNRVQFDDITGIIGSNLELLSTITGVDAKGIMAGETPQKTATEVLSGERQTQCTIRHFYANLRDTFKSVGETVMQLLGMGKVVLEVIQGPEQGIELQVARQELMTLMSVVPEDKRMSLINGIFLTHPDNAVMKNVFGSINMNPGPTQMEMQQQDVIEQMKNAIGQKDMQIQDLQEQIKRYEMFQDNNERDLHAQFAKAAMDHKYKQEDMILQAQLDAGLDTDKAAIENEKAIMDLQKQAIQLDTAKVKANTEMAKAMFGGMNNEN